MSVVITIPNAPTVPRDCICVDDETGPYPQCDICRGTGIYTESMQLQLTEVDFKIMWALLLIHPTDSGQIYPSILKRAIRQYQGLPVTQFSHPPIIPQSCFTALDELVALAEKREECIIWY